MKPKLRNWYGFVKAQPCFSCGAFPTTHNPVEAAHFRLLVSRKTGQLLPRSHQGEAAWGCVPLCRECHQRQHEGSERDFLEENPLLPQYWGTLLVRFFVFEEEAPF